MAIDVCSEIPSLSISPRISFSHDLNQANSLLLDDHEHNRRRFLDLASDFDFCTVTDDDFTFEISSADELFSQGKILATEIKTKELAQKLPSSPEHSIEKPSKIVEKPSSTIDFSGSIVESPGNTIDKSRSTIKNPSSTIDFSGSIVEKPSSTVDKSRSTLKKARSTIDFSRSVVEKPGSTIDFSGSIVRKPSSIIDQSRSTIKKASSTIEFSGSLGEKPSRILEKSSRTIERSKTTDRDRPKLTNSTINGVEPKKICSLKELLSASLDEEDNDENDDKSRRSSGNHHKSFWQFRRSTSLNMEKIKSLHFISRSNSTGSGRNPGFRRQKSLNYRRSTSFSSGNRHCYSYGKGGVSPVLNLPQPYIAKVTVGFFGIGSLLCNGKHRKKKK